MSPKMFKMTIVVLAAIAVVLGYLIYRSGSSSENTLAPKSASPEQVPSLISDEQVVLKTPQKDATDAEKQKHFELVKKLAKQSDTLDVTSCVSKPVVLQAKETSSFTAVNNDSTAHTIYINKAHSFTVPANGKSTVVVDFGYGPGVYGYGCDTSRGATGIFFVTQ